MVLAGFLGLIERPVQRPSSAAESGAVIKTETKLVLVDAVVTDKKGGYVRDLTAKDFKVSEDKQEQTIKTFAFEADPNSPTASQKRYLVLFLRQFHHVLRRPGAGAEGGLAVYRKEWGHECADGHRQFRRQHSDLRRILPRMWID